MEVAAIVAENLLPQELGVQEHARSRLNRPLSALTPKVSVTATTAPGAALHSCLKRHSRSRGCRRPSTAPGAWKGPRAPPAPALPQPGPRRRARGESRAPRGMGQTRCRAPARPPSRPQPRSQGPGKARPICAGRAGPGAPAALPTRAASTAPALRAPSPGAEGAGRAGVPAWRTATSNRAPPGRLGAWRDRYPSSEGAPVTHRLTPRPPPRRHRSPAPVAAALLQPQAPPSSPIYKLGARS